MGCVAIYFILTVLEAESLESESCPGNVLVNLYSRSHMSDFLCSFVMEQRWERLDFCINIFGSLPWPHLRQSLQSMSGFNLEFEKNKGIQLIVPTFGFPNACVFTMLNRLAATFQTIISTSNSKPQVSYNIIKSMHKARC